MRRDLDKTSMCFNVILGIVVVSRLPIYFEVCKAEMGQCETRLGDKLVATVSATPFARTREPQHRTAFASLRNLY